MPAIVTAILSLLAQAPEAIAEITSVYNSVRGGLSATDQATIDSVLAAAEVSDAAATALADTALSAAAGRP